MRFSYHQEVRLGPMALLNDRKDARAREVLGQGYAQVGIVEGAQVDGLRSVCEADLASLDGKIGLA